MAKQRIEKPSVELGRQVAPTNFDFEESSERDSCPLVARRCKRKQAAESSDSKSTISFPIKDFAKRRRTQRQHKHMGWTGANIASQSDHIPISPTEDGRPSGEDNLIISSGEHERMEFNQNEHSSWSNISAQMNIFEEMMHFRKEGETEEVSELFERRSLILYKIFVMEVEKVYHEHLANFKLDDPSVNHDYFCIRRLHKELKVIATVHKNHQAMAGLPIVDEEVLFLESTSNQPLLLEFSSLADQEQAAAQTGGQQLDQPDNENTSMISHEHLVQENEPPVQIDGNQAVGNEHQAHDEHVNVPGSDRSLEEHSTAIVLSENNPETVTTSEKNNYDHQGPVPSNLRNHTTLLREQLKNVVDGLEIKIDVLERTFSKRMDDSHQHFTKLETTMVRNYADSHQQLVDELASVKSQLAAMVESIKEFGTDKKGEGGQNRSGQGLNRSEEGSSGE
ncbi:Leucine-rich repeat receptor-like protein kinase family protein [Dorcoceras hygrometricum]|uniref:Leucine-rich repeat receptor-like protein kinase family protein n=1 Tax=Dorcoceras hygrometricum TaxID=472368 RepID=A0A2Z7B8L2_9LAMI|nr:Leucine-rich repeat receptor-like protein kinase family protein [Dorcoceras hygrometricum]